VRSLARTVDYSTGVSRAGGGQAVYRHLLLVKSDDPMGATYVVMRDLTRDGQPKQEFFWNLWCMAKAVEPNGNVAHFPGQFGVDLDAHVLSPAKPQFVKDHWLSKSWVHPWGHFSEEQYGVHVRKQGSKEDFLAVLYPRAAGQASAQVTPLADARGVSVKHMEGTDVVLLSPGKAATVTVGDVRLAGEIAFARRYTDGGIRLAVVKGAEATAAVGPWELRSNGPVAVAVKGKAVTGESSGEAHVVQIALPPTYGTAVVTLDGKPIAARRNKGLLALDVPAGPHRFAINEK